MHSSFFKKSNLQNDLDIPLQQKAAHRNFIINAFSFAKFCVTRAKLHFGEFSNPTFQAVSWLLLFSLGCLQARHSFIFPRNTTRTFLFALRQDFIFPLRRDYIFPLRVAKAWLKQSSFSKCAQSLLRSVDSTVRRGAFWKWRLPENK